jgi:putative FmdB family regulatory protein
MPIYAYKCESCGHAKDVLQKMSDPLLTVCPECGESAFKKQLTSAGFHLKGSGWYVTDFRGDKPSADAGDAAKTNKPAETASTPASAPATASSPAASAPASAPSSPAAAPAASSTPSSTPSSTKPSKGIS